MNTVASCWTMIKR